MYQEKSCWIGKKQKPEMKVIACIKINGKKVEWRSLSANGISLYKVNRLFDHGYDINSMTIHGLTGIRIYDIDNKKSLSDISNKLLDAISDTCMRTHALSYIKDYEDIYCTEEEDVYIRDFKHELLYTRVINTCQKMIKRIKNMKVKNYE